MKTHFRKILRAVQRSARYAHLDSNTQCHVADEIIADLQPKGRGLCACNRRWLRIVKRKAIPTKNHGWDDCNPGKGDGA